MATCEHEEGGMATCEHGEGGMATCEHGEGGMATCEHEEGDMATCEHEEGGMATCEHEEGGMATCEHEEGGMATCEHEEGGMATCEHEEGGNTTVSSDSSDGHYEQSKSLTAPQQDVSLQERFGDLDIFKEPMCLVFNDDEMKLQINEAVLQEFSLIDVPVSVVGVCGVYRSGKSYLMNKLFQETKGFPLGSSIRSKTKGIWVWCKPHPTVPDQVLVLLDTEGLSDAVKRDPDHDTKIFSLTMLMSSVLIYNLKGIIDQDALSKLSFITEVTKVISVSGCTNNEGEDTALQYISPHFVLCLRDFFYELVDEGEMTADQYMEECLDESPDQQNDEFNSIRQSIKTFFPRRKCFVMAMPAINKKLRKLETLPDEDLDEDFKNDVQKMITFLHSSGPKLSDEITRKRWTGTTFEAFLRIYIQELSGGKKMDYISAMQAASINHNEKLQAKVCHQYQADLDEYVLPDPSKNKLFDMSMELMLKLSREFRQDAYPYQVAEYEERGMEKMKSMRDVLLAKNSSQVQEICYMYLSKELENMVQNNQERYVNIKEYEKDTDELLQKYHKKFDTYDEEERTMAFQKVISDTKNQVLELKHRANLEECKKRYEQTRKEEREAFERKMETTRKERDMELNNQLKAYDDRMVQSMADLKQLQEQDRGREQRACQLQNTLDNYKSQVSQLWSEKMALTQELFRLRNDVDAMKARGCLIQ